MTYGIQRKPKIIHSHYIFNFFQFFHIL